MLAELRTSLADLERAARAAEGRDDDLAGMVAGVNRAFGALCRVLEEDRPGHRGATAGGARRGGGRPGGELQRAGDREDAVDARVHSGVPAGHRQVHEPENRQGQVVKETPSWPMRDLRRRTARWPRRLRRRARQRSRRSCVIFFRGGTLAGLGDVPAAESASVVLEGRWLIPVGRNKVRKSPRIYARGGRLSDMERLLERSETELQSRLVWRLVMARYRDRGPGPGGRDATVPQQMRNTDRANLRRHVVISHRRLHRDAGR